MRTNLARLFDVPVRFSRFFRIPTPAVMCLPLLGGLALGSSASAQLYDFNDGTDPGWTHYDPIFMASEMMGLGLGPQGTWSFPDGHYRIQAARSPMAQLGPGRAGSLLQNRVYTSFYLQVDLYGWDDSVNQAFGFLARVQPDPTPGTTCGYALTYQPHNHDIQISHVVNESANEIPPTSASIASLHLYPTNAYRFVFLGRGSEFEGRVYLLSNLKYPMVTVKAENNVYASGTVGLVVFDNSGGSGIADATFDNFFVATDEQPKLSISMSSIQEVTLRWPATVSGFSLQWTDDITSPAAWSPATGDVVRDGDDFTYLDDAYTGNRFYRLYKP